MTDYKKADAVQALHALAQLSDLLQACVAEGASIGFTDPQNRQAIEDFWHTRAASLIDGESELMLACQQERVVGTVMMTVATMPNGRHRAEIGKLLVHPHARRQGIARELMLRAERRARALGKTLLVLDTRSGDVASQLYLSLGWQIAGSIPDYAESIKGELEATTVMFKLLTAN
ncbi:GNAT family N-acetyltransferase [Pantoea sp. KPR_PJ]|uniref:GNAT family N-acetyltransferase n=1 Tax=Pantoea sp. KPR_PJ TaxID=2738375 RepID=UPI00352705E5